MSHMNMGICYDEVKEYKQAAQYFLLEVFWGLSQHSFLTSKTTKNLEITREALEKGMQIHVNLP